MAQVLRGSSSYTEAHIDAEVERVRNDPNLTDEQRNEKLRWLERARDKIKNQQH